MIGRRGVLGVAAALAAGARRAAAAGDDTLVFGLSNYPATLRPFAQAGNSGNAVKLLMHRGLASYTKDGVVQPELAAHWQDVDARVWTFTLREARFHNGDPVTAEDVRFTYDSIRKPRSTAFLKAAFEGIDTIEVASDRVVRITLKRPMATFLELVASVNAPVISMKSPEDQPESPIGCGPYRLMERVRGERILMRRFEGYYKAGLPRIPQVSFVAFNDENLRQAALETGSIDMMEGVPWQSIAKMEKNKALTVQSGIGGYFYLKFNFKTGKFTDPRVRQAMGFAIDRQAITDAAFFGQGAPLYGLPIPDGPLFPAQEAGPKFRYDKARAKALLAEAGYPNGFSTSVLTLNDPGTFQRACEVVQQNLADIGVQLEIALADYGTVTSRGDRGQYEFSLYGATGFSNDPDGITPMLTGPANYLRSFGYSSARVDGLLEEGRSETEPAKRRATYLALQQACFEECPIIGLSWRAQAYAMKAEVHGFEKMPYFLNAYSPFEIEGVSRG